MENFNLKKFLVENKLTTNSKMLNENEAEAPRTITVKVTQKGKTAMRLYTGPSEIKITGGSDSNYYYIGNTQAESGKETNIYFAVYRHDIKEIQTMYLVLTLPAEQFRELVNSQYLSPQQLASLPSDIKKVPDAYFSFEEGITPGATDHRGFFEIVKV